MINLYEVSETNHMIESENLDVRTITLGISLIDCISDSLDRLCDNIQRKIVTLGHDLVRVGDKIEAEFGFPVVNKRVAITPASIIGASACRKPSDYVRIAKTLDKAATEIGVNFIGGYSALVSKDMTAGEEMFIRSIPEALASTERVCASVVAGSSKTGINMDIVRMMGDVIRETAELTKDQDSIGCAKLVVLCNAPDDNPFMAGAFLGVTEGDSVINVGVSGPGVVQRSRCGSSCTH